ncbi:hypothetical protein SFRURICE_011806 [Spodoptera frugiperda]|uniref:SFRICE_029783 n=1 Tax=Spodoptera frugiperda TaxID=7108 RepID=A0A2H1VQ42_SPOFR|nr:hypothetical protein SFRURICE_011806 [Spodoptera frugiperda]
MAFSIRKMFSNISYFSKSGEQSQSNEHPVDESVAISSSRPESSQTIEFVSIEPDSTSKPHATSLKLPTSVKNFAAKKGSLSDTDLLNIDEVSTRGRKPKSRSLKIDIKQASRSMNESLYQGDRQHNENTPPHISLDCQSANLFSQRFKQLNFSQSFEFDISTESDEELDIESLSECSDTDLSGKEDKKSRVKMCRKVDTTSDNQLVRTGTPESFGDVELERNEEERVSLLLSYQMKLEKIECVLRKLLAEFQFHIEVAKIFTCRSFVTMLPGTDLSEIPKMFGQVTYINHGDRDSPVESWNFVIDKEDDETKYKFRKQMLDLRHSLDTFVGTYLQEEVKPKAMFRRSITFDLHKGKRLHKTGKVTNKKRIKHFDFPDYRDAFLNLFKETESEETDTHLEHSNDESDHKCSCQCHNHSISQSDSGLVTKDSMSNQSITSSIGNFSLDSTTLSAFSESLDQVISYNSFEDSTLFNTLQQKPAIERITFYVQVHSIQIRSESENEECKNSITFFCPACSTTEVEEDGLLKHILSQSHCEKIHFLYKSVYIKKCVAGGKEIQPSTVLNPMTMYRDDNKIVCFGDAVYACSLCFENPIVGESVLMAHCSDETHADRREKMYEMFD